MSRCLIVDGSSVVRKVAKRILASDQDMVTEAEIGRSALDLVADRDTREIYPADVKLVDQINAKFKDRRLLIKAHSGHLINLSPPLCTTRDDLDEIVEGISEVLGEVQAELDV